METVGQMIIRHLSHGKTQKQISDIFKKEYVEPNSLSSIEKILKSIRKKNNCTTNFQLGWELCKIQILSDVAHVK